MKTKLLTTALFALFLALPVLAQDRTTVNATSYEISDNLDLRAIASIFGEARNLEDFERQLNDPKIQISNLDLNNDNKVDYLRVIESVEGYTHLIIVQSVLGMDTFQDVATIEVERDRNNQVSVQVVGDVYMYGDNYIYEPVYVSAPVIYSSFWVNHYRPYASGWYWGYYPSYYYVWTPYPVFRYRNNIHVHINYDNHYNYVNVRRSNRAVALYNGRRSNYIERQYPTRSFAYRNANVTNRYELDKNRPARNVATRNEVAHSTPRNSGTDVRTTSNTTRNYDTPARENTGRTNSNTVRENNTGRSQTGIRTNPEVTRNNTPVRAEPAATTRANTTIRPQMQNSNAGSSSGISRNESSSAGRNVQVRNTTPSNTAIRSTPQRQNTTVRSTGSADAAQRGGRR